MVSNFISDLTHDTLPENANLDDMIEILSKLPYCNRATLSYVLRFLRLVADNEDINKMSISNLSVVWGPSLAKPHHETDLEQWNVSINCCNYLIRNQQDLFKDIPIPMPRPPDLVSEERKFNREVSTVDQIQFLAIDLKGDLHYSPVHSFAIYGKALFILMFDYSKEMKLMQRERFESLEYWMKLIRLRARAFSKIIMVGIVDEEKDLVSKTTSTKKLLRVRFSENAFEMWDGNLILLNLNRNVKDESFHSKLYETVRVMTSPCIFGGWISSMDLCRSKFSLPPVPKPLIFQDFTIPILNHTDSESIFNSCFAEKELLLEFLEDIGEFCNIGVCSRHMIYFSWMCQLLNKLLLLSAKYYTGKSDYDHSLISLTEVEKELSSCR